MNMKIKFIRRKEHILLLLGKPVLHVYVEQEKLLNVIITQDK
jgi:hypothetical protein